MAAEFRRVRRLQGFDKDQTPKWQMIPVGADRFVILRDGAALTLSAADPAIATVAEIKRADLPAGDLAEVIQATDRLFKIHALKWGITTIDAKNALGASVVKLEVDTKNKKTVRITFNFVKDNAGHSTKRAPAAVAEWVKGINWIYERQVNVQIVKKTARWVTVPQNLGRVVRFSSHLPGVPAAQHEWAAVTALGEATADMNFFFVWEYEQDNTPFTDQTDAGTLTNNCIFEDKAGKQMGETLAHEIGHYLGRPDHYDAARTHHLMHGITDARGIHIPKPDANGMNP